MVRDSKRALIALTFLLVSIASVSTEIAASPDHMPLSELAPRLGIVLLWILFAGVGYRLTRSWVSRSGEKLPWPCVVILVALFIAPPATESLTREWFGFGRPLEMQLVIGLRNLTLGFVALSAASLALRMAAVSGLFLVLFSVAVCPRPEIVVLTMAFGLVGSLWLVCRYRESLLGTVIANEQPTGATLLRTKLPLRRLSLLVFLVSTAVLLPVIGPDRAVAFLGELVPTSGGTGDQDPFSRGGVNDGPEEAAGSNPMSTGFVKTDQFLDSPLPSLYDVSTDMFGEPRKPNEQERTIALSLGQVRELPKPPPDSQRPSRSFSTHRQAPRQPRFPEGRSARALFEVEGRTPLHVRVASYDFFDGYRWHEAFVGVGGARIQQEPEGNWMSLFWGPRNRDFFADDDEHSFKIAKLKGRLLPTPPHLTHFRVGQVDQPNWFSWLHGQGTLTLVPRDMPSGITIETRCRTIDRDRLESANLWTSRSGEDSSVQLPNQLVDPRIPELAEAWTSGSPRGWPQVRAILDRLRSEYTFDREYREPADCHDPLSHFLFESRRGPDYQFANATVVMLRSLGYPTRLTQGFYAAPAHYDSESGHTPVVAEDLHWWPELRLPNGDWIVLEPTPGYDTLGPYWNWSTRLLATFDRLWSWVVSHPILTISLVAIFLLLIWKRRYLIDRLLVCRWYCLRHGSWRGCVLSTCRLLERRARSRTSTRACKIIKKACFDVLEKLGVRTKLLEIAVELEEIALKDDYFVERKLYPNVDFYSGVIYNAIGTPANMFTAMFAARPACPAGSRSGWSCTTDPDFKIGRPRQIYTGATSALLHRRSPSAEPDGPWTADRPARSGVDGEAAARRRGRGPASTTAPTPRAAAATRACAHSAGRRRASRRATSAG